LPLIFVFDFENFSIPDLNIAASLEINDYLKYMRYFITIENNEIISKI